jgi:hypothetical protein
MWPVRAIAEQKRRLEALAYLSRTPGYEASADLIKEHLREIGVPTNSAEITATLAWLAALDLVTLRHPARAPVARVTEAGRETAAGFRQVPGVMAPDP